MICYYSSRCTANIYGSKRAISVSCLETVLAEGQKPANVDIYLMWINIERCRQIIQQLHGTEKDQLYSHVLVNLEQTLNNHTDILQAKIKQLNGNEATGTTSTIADGAKKRKKSPETVSDGERSQRRSAIEETIIGKGGLMFDDIAGLKDAKQALREAIIIPLHYPHLFTGGIKPWKRILLYGPPGTGKSRLAQAISSEINSTFYCVSSSDLVSSWVGESEKLIKELFNHATNQEGRSVIFIDEIDSICRQRNSREEEHTRRVKTELLKQMEGADNSDSADKIFLLCATNCPWELDTAFLRRFQKRIYIPLPGKEARKDLMKIHTRDNKIDLTDTEWDQLCERTEGYSGSDIANMMLEALFGPIRDLQVSTHWKQRQDGKFMPCNPDEDLSIEATMNSFPPEKVIPRNVAIQDFEKSVQSHGRTVTDVELKRFDDFTTSFGENG